MKTNINNSKGYALIVVLLIIVVIAIMTPPVISRIMSSSAQFERVEEKLQLEKLKEMGVLYVETAIPIALNLAEGKVNSWLMSLEEDDEIPTPEQVAERLNTEFQNEMNMYFSSNIHEIIFKHSSYKFKVIYTSSATTAMLRVEYDVDVTLDKEYKDRPISTEQQFNSQYYLHGIKEIPISINEGA